jgi:hypothetical protein
MQVDYRNADADGPDYSTLEFRTGIDSIAKGDLDEFVTITVEGLDGLDSATVTLNAEQCRDLGNRLLEAAETLKTTVQSLIVVYN